MRTGVKHWTFSNNTCNFTSFFVFILQGQGLWTTKNFVSFSFSFNVCVWDMYCMTYAYLDYLILHPFFKVEGDTIWSKDHRLFWSHFLRNIDCFLFPFDKLRVCFRIIIFVFVWDQFIWEQNFYLLHWTPFIDACLHLHLLDTMWL